MRRNFIVCILLLSDQKYIKFFLDQSPQPIPCREPIIIPRITLMAIPPTSISGHRPPHPSGLSAHEPPARAADQPVKPLPAGKKEYVLIAKGQPRRTSIEIHADDRIRFLGSSTAVNIHEDNAALLRAERAGVIGRYGSDPEMVLKYLKDNWSALDVGFQDGMSFVLVGMGFNEKLDGRSPEAYATGTLDGYMKIVDFLEGKAREQGKHIRVLISGLQPQPQLHQKSKGIQLFNQKLRTDPRFSKHYDPSADLALAVTTPDGQWKPGVCRKDGKHIKPEILRGFVEKFLEKTRPKTTGGIDPSWRGMARLFTPPSNLPSIPSSASLQQVETR